MRRLARGYIVGEVEVRAVYTYPSLPLRMPPPRVGVIGAGVSGSVLAILLKLKGYDPVLYERNEGVTEAGLGIG